MRSFSGLVLFVGLLASSSLASDIVHQAPNGFLKSWVEGPIRLGEQHELTLGPLQGSPQQLLQHTQVVPVNEVLPAPESASGVVAWRDCYSITRRTDGTGFRVSLYRDGTWKEAGKLPDCVLSDAEWYDGELHFLMRPAKAQPISTHLYSSQVTPSGSITPPALVALAPAGMILEKFAVTRDGLYGVGRAAGDEHRRLVYLRGIENHSPGWSDCGEVRVPSTSEWDITSRGNHLVLFSPSLRDIDVCPAPHMGQMARWERKHLEQGPWREVLCRTMDRLEAKSGIPPRIIHQFNLTEPAQVAGVRVNVVGTTPPRFRWRLANAATNVYSDWSHFSMEEYVPINEAAQYVQYEIRSPEDESPVGIREITLVLADSPASSEQTGSEEAGGIQLQGKAQMAPGLTPQARLTQVAPDPVSTGEMAWSLSQEAQVLHVDEEPSVILENILAKTGLEDGITDQVLTHNLDKDLVKNTPDSKNIADSGKRESPGEEKTTGPEDRTSTSDRPTSGESFNLGQTESQAPELASTGSAQEPSSTSNQSGTPSVSPSSNGASDDSSTSSGLSGEGAMDSSQSFPSTGTPSDQTGNLGMDTGTETPGNNGNTTGNGHSGSAGENGASSQADATGTDAGQGISVGEDGSSGTPGYGGTTDGPASFGGGSNGQSVEGNETGHGSNTRPDDKSDTDSGSSGEVSGEDATQAPPNSQSNPDSESTNGHDSGHGFTAKTDDAPTTDTGTNGKTGKGDSTRDASAANDRPNHQPGSDMGTGQGSPTHTDGHKADGPRFIRQSLPYHLNSDMGISNGMSQWESLARLNSGDRLSIQESKEMVPDSISPSLSKVAADYLIPTFLALFVLLLAVGAFNELCGRNSMIAPRLRPTLPSLKWEEQKRAETTQANLLAASSISSPSSPGETVTLPILPVLPEREKGKIEWRVAEPLPRPMAPATAFYHHGAVYVVDPHGTICHARLRANGSLCPWGVRVGRLPSHSAKGLTAFVAPYIVCVSGDEISIARIEGDEPGEWRLAGKLDGLHEVTAVAGLGNRLFLVGGGSKGNPFPAVRSVEIDSQGHLGMVHCHPPLPLGVTEGTLATGGNSLYWLGGTSHGKVSRKVFSAQVGAGSEFEEWCQEPDLPWGQRHPTVEFWGGALWMVLNKPMGDESVVYKGKRNQTGSIGQWEATGQHLPEPVHSASLPFAGGQFLLLGGWMELAGKVPRTEVLGWKPAWPL